MTTGADGDRLELLESPWSALLGGAPGIGLAWTTLALGPRWAHGVVHRSQAPDPGYPWQPTMASPDPWAPPPS